MENLGLKTASTDDLIAELIERARAIAFAVFIPGMDEPIIRLKGRRWEYVGLSELIVDARIDHAPTSPEEVMVDGSEKRE